MFGAVHKDRLRAVATSYPVARKEPDALLAIHLLLLRMNEASESKVSLIQHYNEVQVRATRGTDPQLTEEWPPIQIPFHLIRRHLAIMTAPSHPWWHAFRVWNRMTFRISNKLDDRFWHPPLAPEGRVIIGINDRGWSLNFRVESKDRLELWLSVAKLEATA